MDWIRQSNLIEGVDDPKEDERSFRAWWWFQKQPRLTAVSVLEVHRRIMSKHLGKEAGNYRTCNVTVGGRLCPPWASVPKLDAMWHLAWGDANTPEKIKMAHIRWEKIHPFVDGNGRTGRFIMNWQRLHAGLEPLEIKFSERGDYYRWFKG